VYITEAVALPDVEYALKLVAPNDPEPLEPTTMSRFVPEFVDPEPVLLFAPTYALCVGLAETDARVEVAGAVSKLTATTTVSPVAAVDGRLMTIGV
jgi:hypothetical protein